MDNGIYADRMNVETQCNKHLYNSLHSSLRALQVDV